VPVPILAILALAQMPWSTTLPSRGVALNFLRPKFDVGGTSLTSGAAFLSGRFPTGGDFSLRVEVPFAHLDVSGSTSSAFGNPYIGLEQRQAEWTFDLGFRPALTPDDEFAAQVGLVTDVTQIEAWIPHAATLATRAAYRHQSTTGMTTELGFAPELWIPTQGGDVEFVINHFGSLGYRGSKVWTALGIGGVLSLTADGDFGERSFYQLGGSVGLTQGQVRPAVHFIVPLDDAVNDLVDFAIGVGVGVAIK
jgi:hypothetical protein